MRCTTTWKRVVVVQAVWLLGGAGVAGAVTPTNVTKVARVTGATPAGELLPNPNQTHSNYEVYGTDLGIVWDKGGGEVFVLFGDTFGAGWCGNGGCGGGWRSNVLARSADATLSNGLTFTTMVQDGTRHAKEILPSRKVDNDEMTVIPTAGVTVGSRHYIHYMSVRHWGDPGQWITNHAGIAYSDDNGQSWVKHASARWVNNATWTNPFQMAAMVKNGGFVYLFATPNGRFGNVHLARVPEGALLDITELYFISSQWTPYNTFLMRASLTADTQGDNLLSEPGFETQAATPTMAPWYLTGGGGIDRALGSARTGQDNGFVRGSSGWSALKQSVVVQPYTDYTLKGWLRASPNTSRGSFGVRAAGNGPILGESSFGSLTAWTERSVTFNSGANSVVEVYGGVWADAGDTWAQLDDVSLIRGANLVAQASFEQQPSGTATSPWYALGNAGIDRGLGFARTGANNAWVRNNTGWNALKQEVAVAPNTRYTLTAWVKTSANQSDGYFGARGLNNGPVLNETHLTQALGNYTRLSVAFDSGANHAVEVYAGTWANAGDTWLQVDDVAVTRD
ncbi:MAG: DUF4185 domain-containing protein [Myxococcaceae bacterium]|nr:MAG: DUF4185 domain-containing protein [Myxococcaceae bacterium]